MAFVLDPDVALNGGTDLGDINEFSGTLRMDFGEAATSTSFNRWGFNPTTGSGVEVYQYPGRWEIHWQGAIIGSGTNPSLTSFQPTGNVSFSISSTGLVSTTVQFSGTYTAQIPGTEWSDADTSDWVFRGDEQGPSGQVFTGNPTVTTSTPQAAPCFTKGTRIRTPQGDVPIEELKVGDVVLTMDHGYQPIRWIGSKRVSYASLLANPKLLPVRISAGTLGTGLPKVDLLVSRQHRMLVRSEVVQEMFGSREVLVAAIKLCKHRGIKVDTSVKEVEYFHMLFDQHQIVFAEGTPSESLLTGKEAMRSLSVQAREEILDLFPEIEAEGYLPSPARQIPPERAQKELIARQLVKVQAQA